MGAPVFTYNRGLQLAGKPVGTILIQLLGPIEDRNYFSANPALTHIQVFGTGEVQVQENPTFAFRGENALSIANAGTFGSQVVDVGGTRVGGDATGLANDATVYTATIDVDGGGPQAIAVTGSAAQTYTTLITELNADTTGAVWKLSNGNLIATSNTTSGSSSIDIVDTDVFSTLTTFVAVNAATAGVEFLGGNSPVINVLRHAPRGATGINGWVNLGAVIEAADGQVFRTLTPLATFNYVQLVITVAGTGKAAFATDWN